MQKAKTGLKININQDMLAQVLGAPRTPRSLLPFEFKVASHRDDAMRNAPPSHLGKSATSSSVVCSLN